MNGTPRLRSAFPETPKTEPRARTVTARQSNSSPQNRPTSRPSVIRPSSSLSRPSEHGPAISLDLLDAPTQRAYVLAFYVGLWAWRLYNSWNLQDELDSTWLFFKWSGIDAAFFVALPAFRIPWMEFSFITTISLWALHMVLNAFLMFHIPIPILAWLGAATRLVWDTELSISENAVTPGRIINNSSIILGKQIINLLPEGSAILNPDRKAFCIDPSRPIIELPIRINQTTPETIELLRYDLETDNVETIIIGSKQAKKLKNEADKGHEKSDTSTPRTLHYSVSKTGLYQLQRVVDKSKLEVRKRSFDVAVVACPQASVTANVVDRCIGDLSGISLHVAGVPPFTVKYSKRINQQQFSSISQSIQSADSEQATADDGTSNVVLDPKRPHMGWTQATTLSVDINESLHQNGTWAYTIEEVEDGLANKIMYTPEKSKRADPTRHSQSLTVHKRPLINLNGCDSEHFLRVAKEDSINMPLQVKPPGQFPAADWPLKLKYTFVSEEEGQPGDVEEVSYDMTGERSLPRISKAGRYDLVSVESQFCQGEIREPSTCLLYNPPRPALSIDHEEIHDKCAGRPIGMIVNLDFTGSPPFKVHYVVNKEGHGSYAVVRDFNSMRGQIEFREKSAGSYSYEITELSDEIYGPISVRGQQQPLKQDIKPPAQAAFRGGTGVIKACLGQPVSVEVGLQGEGPWDLDYELVHGGRRKKYSVACEDAIRTINIPELAEGGKYTLVLTGVQDRSRCRTALKEERHIEVRPEQPWASFGDIQGRRAVDALQGKSVKIPLRLRGIAPWTLRIQNTADDSPPREHIFRDANAVINADHAGTYQILSVHDTCPGQVEPKADKFIVSYIKRPELSVVDSSVETRTKHNFRKLPVCQGDEDVLNLGLGGHPPYHLKYQIKFDSSKGPPAISNKPLSVASSNAIIHMDTSKAGEYTYTFSELADDRYDYDKKHFTPIVVKQQIYAPPTAAFAKAGSTYGYCKDEAASNSDLDSENIPITFTGVPPFAIDIAIIHQGVSSRPETIRVKDILATSYSWALSRSTLGLGTHTVQIRSVKDSRGCETLVDSNPSSIKIQVSSPPTINPLESTTDYCVGDRVSFSLSGQSPFDVFYTFQGRERKAHVKSNEFKRIAESPGDFIITGISDSAMGGGGKCKARKDLQKTIHPYPTVRISHGKTLTSDIHEGGDVEIMFEFTGTPPFEFTYTRSENAKRGRKPQVLETRHDSSDTFSKTVRASDEGTYEVVAIKDRYCSYSAPGLAKANAGNSQKLLMN